MNVSNDYDIMKVFIKLFSWDSLLARQLLSSQILLEGRNVFKVTACLDITFPYIFQTATAEGKVFFCKKAEKFIELTELK